MKLTSVLISVVLSAVAINGARFSIAVSEADRIELPAVCQRVAVNVPAAETPRDLTVAWLEFHETGLCEEVDAEFRFLGRGIEVWCLFEDEKSYEKLNRRLEPLRASYEVRVEGTQLAAEERTPADRNPPPSLWNNEELRLYFQNWYDQDNDLFGRTKSRELFDRTASEFGLKNRIRLFSLQVLDWAGEMQRQGFELPSLACAAVNPAIAMDLRSRAAATCLAHAEEIGKNARKLESNLSHAFPRSSGRSGDAAGLEYGAAGSLAEDAARISRTARNLANRVYRFVYPLDHTVGLADLREPPLLDALARLGEMVQHFEARPKEESAKAPVLP